MPTDLNGNEQPGYQQQDKVIETELCRGCQTLMRASQFDLFKGICEVCLSLQPSDY